MEPDQDVMYLGTSSSCSVTKDELKASFPLGDSFIELMFGFSNKFNAFQLTQGEVALFSALMLITPGKFMRLLQFYNDTVT